MLESNRLLIHIGYHKTGSTWCQQVLFADPDTGFSLPWRRDEVNTLLVEPTELHFDAARASEAMAAARAEPDRESEIAVISDERFSGNPHSGGWDSKLLADRLRAVFPQARILGVIRAQRSVLRSTFFQYVREGGVAPLRRYLEPPTAGRYRIPLFDPDFYAYDALIAYYQKLFGRERVLFLPYEMLQRNRDSFVERVCAFSSANVPVELTEARPNPGLSPLSVALKRPLNRLFVADRLNPAPLLASAGANVRLSRAFAKLDAWLPDVVTRGGGGAGRMERTIDRFVGDRYRESNRRSAELIGIDLGEYGYQL